MLGEPSMFKMKRRAKDTNSSAPALQFFFAFFASFFCETRGEKKVEGLEVRLNKRRYVYAGTHHRLSIPWGEIKVARSSRKRGVVGSSRGGFEIQEAEVLSC